MRKLVTSFGLVLALAGDVSATTATTRGVNPSGDTLFWIVLTIALALLLTGKFIRTLIVSPILIIPLLILLIIAYIVFSAFSISFGLGDMIDVQIQNAAGVIQSIRGN